MVAISNRITTIFDTDTKGFASGVKNIKKQIAETDGAFKKMKVGAKGAIDSFKQSNTQQAAAIAGLGAAAYKAVSLASDLEESVNAVQVTFGEAAEDVLKIGENSATSFGLSKAEFNNLAVSFAAFAKQAAGPGGDVAGTIEDMATRVADFASVMNLDLATATQVFQSSLAGQTEPIRKYGKDLSAAAVEQYALNNGLIETKSELTETIKVQARYGLLMQETADTAGDFANTSDRQANAQRITSAQFQDFAAQLGEDLMPALGAIVQGMSDLLTVAEKLGVTEVFSWLDDLGPKAEEVGNSLRSIFDKKAKENFAIRDEFDRTTEAIGQFDKSLLDGAESFAEVREIVLENTEGIEGWTDTTRIANEIALEWKEGQEQAGEAIEDVTESTDDAKRANQLAYVELKKLDGKYDDLGGTIEDTTGDIEDSEEAVDDLKTSFQELREEISEKRALEDLQTAWEDMQTAAEEAFTAAAEGAEDADEKLADLETATDDMRLAVLYYGEELGLLPDERTTEILAMIDEGNLQAVKDELDKLERTRETLLWINAQVRQNAGSAYLPSVNTPGNMTVAAPARATGGPVSAGRPYVVGERGPELMIPGTNGSIVPNNKLGGSTYNVTVNAGIGTNGADVGRQVVEQIKRFERVNGSGWRS